jgi:hypothetical protein
MIAAAHFVITSVHRFAHRVHRARRGARRNRAELLRARRGTPAAQVSGPAASTPRPPRTRTMKTLDLQDLDAVCGGTLDNKAMSSALTLPKLPSLPSLPSLPRDLPLPKLPAAGGTIPLGPFVPPTINPYIA